ncbi:hypothetical protein KKB18_12755, partial [bacterium]|nr:hypothetical protein [bacterium]
IEKSGKVMPAILLVTPGIDLLRPVNDWNPPFNLDEPSTLKEKSISSMVEVVSKELGEAIIGVVPVCLLDEQLYNVTETLIPIIYSLLPEAKRVLLVRVMKDIKHSENLKLLFRQAIKSGKLVIDFLGKLTR